MRDNLVINFIEVSASNTDRRVQFKYEPSQGPASDINRMSTPVYILNNGCVDINGTIFNADDLEYLAYKCRMLKK